VRVFYLDTSAAMKLLRHEEETPALVAWWKRISPHTHQLVSSDLIRTELMLTGTHHGVPGADIRHLVQALSLLRVTSAVCDSAGRLSGMSLRSLDALHLASALSLGDVLEGLVTYDRRMISAGEKLGVPTISPQ
jgi:predicted nucleic acid-binding protein